MPPLFFSDDFLEASFLVLPEGATGGISRVVSVSAFFSAVSTGVALSSFPCFPVITRYFSFIVEHDDIIRAAAAITIIGLNVFMLL